MSVSFPGGLKDGDKAWISKREDACAKGWAIYRSRVPRGRRIYRHIDHPAFFGNMRFVKRAVAFHSHRGEWGLQWVCIAEQLIADGTIK